MPYITCDAGSTKNRKDAQQFIQPELAAELQSHVTAKAPKAPVFNMPHPTDVAGMLRQDLAAARTAWLSEARRDPDEYVAREQSDFLVATNTNGEIIEFHSLRHTCGAWLAMLGAHPKVIQSVMRHSAITLTMDTYGHLVPGQEADAVARLRGLMAPADALQATGTDDSAVEPRIGAQHWAQQSRRETLRPAATECSPDTGRPVEEQRRKPIRVADLDDGLRQDATEDESGAARTRTWNQRIMSPHAPPLNLEENDDFGEGAAHSTALETAKGTLDPELAQVIEAWPTLPPAIREAILAMLRAAE